MTCTPSTTFTLARPRCALLRCRHAAACCCCCVCGGCGVAVALCRAAEQLAHCLCGSGRPNAHLCTLPCPPPPRLCLCLSRRSGTASPPAPTPSLRPWRRRCIPTCTVTARASCGTRRARGGGAGRESLPARLAHLPAGGGDLRCAPPASTGRLAPPRPLPQPQAAPPSPLCPPHPLLLLRPCPCPYTYTYTYTHTYTYTATCPYTAGHPHLPKAAQGARGAVPDGATGGGRVCGAQRRRLPRRIQPRLQLRGCGQGWVGGVGG